MKVVLCPVCNGRGELDGGLRYTRGNAIPTKIINICHGCNGKGWIEVGEDKTVNKASTTLNWRDWRGCPACGGDRNSPARTGCPMGSHYGSYSDT